MALEEAKERLIERLMADISEILKVTEIKPKRIVIMSSPEWKADMLKEALAHQGKIDVPYLIKSTMSKVPPNSKKEVPNYAKELVAELSKASADDKTVLGLRIDELAAVSAARLFLAEEFGCEIEVYTADDPKRTDPKGKAKFARPGRPAVYVE